jgi:hypothetical protein
MLVPVLDAELMDVQPSDPVPPVPAHDVALLLAQVKVA